MQELLDKLNSDIQYIAGAPARAAAAFCCVTNAVPRQVMSLKQPSTGKR
jgi:hypothetical protein